MAFSLGGRRHDEGRNGRETQANCGVNREINGKGKEARFVKTERGKFGLAKK
jgi:hypothetical protein